MNPLNFHFDFVVSGLTPEAADAMLAEIQHFAEACHADMAGGMARTDLTAQARRDADAAASAERKARIARNIAQLYGAK